VSKFKPKVIGANHVKNCGAYLLNLFESYTILVHFEKKITAMKWSS